MFVIGLVVAEPDLAGKACLGKQFESTIDGSQSDRGIDLMYEAVQVLAGKVFLSAKKDLEDEITLSGTPQSRRLDMLKEDRPFYLEFILFPSQNTPFLQSRYYHFNFDFAIATFARIVSTR